MKFLIINRPTGVPHGHGKGADQALEFSNNLQRLKEEGALEAVYTFIGGGSAYVVTAQDSTTLLRKVRGNPFFETSETEIIPVIDSVEHYRQLAEWRGATSDAQAQAV
jgi:hypothetical protein